MTDEPTFETYYFMVEMKLPSTPDSRVDEDEMAAQIKETLEAENLLDMAAEIQVHAPSSRIRMMTPDALDDLEDEALECMCSTIEETTGETPDTYSREDMLAFLKSGMQDAIDERKSMMH